MSCACDVPEVGAGRTVREPAVADLGDDGAGRRRRVVPGVGVCWWFRFPDVFDGRDGTDAADLSGLPKGRAEYLQEGRFVHPGMRAWLEPSDAAQAIVARLVATYEPATASAVHVRRGDYADGNRGHGMLEADWYLSNWPDGRVLVFSDDPDWCAEHLPGEVVREPRWSRG
jgi:hypothetical protein